MIIIRNLILITFLLYSLKSFGKEIYFQGQINDYSVFNLINEMYEEHNNLPKGEPIKIIMSSNGGSVYSGLYLIDYIEQIKKFRDVNIYISNHCYSMCFTILQSASKRFLFEGGTLMQHPIAIAGKSPKNYSFQDKMLIEELRSIMTQIEIRRMIFKEELWVKLIERDYYIDSKKALEVGAIDGYFDIKLKEYK